MQPIKYKTKYVDEQNAVLFQGFFGDGSIAITVQSIFGEPLGTATVSLKQYGEKPAEGNVFVFGDYAEHEGVWSALHKAGIVGDVVRIIEGPYDSQFYECPLLRKDLRPLT